MVSPASTTLTERQVEVLELRDEGRTQQEVAELLGTTDANVSAVERAAKKNIGKARRTVELVRVMQSRVRFTVEAGSSFDELVDRVYAEGDAGDTDVTYCRPELYSHLFETLEPLTTRNQLDVDVEVGLTADGDVKTFVPTA